MAIEAWVSTALGVYIAHLDRSEASPFRKFAVSRMRGADPGSGALEYNLNNQLLRDNPTLFDFGNLVSMRYRGRTLTWIIEERAAALNEGEHSTDWEKVSGRGAKQLLADRTAWPTAFSGTNQPRQWGKDAQWRRFIDRACGEMLWDLIEESQTPVRPGFAPLTRGTIETVGDDGWTQDFRFDNYLDIAADVCASFGEIDMDGLVFNYYNDPGIDRSTTVIFEEGADLLEVEHRKSDRDTITWSLAEGLGEGITARLALAFDTAIPRRREAFIDAKDASNTPLLQLRSNQGLEENRPIDSLALEVTEERYAALADYDVHDTIRVIAPSRSVDMTARIVAMYLVEDDSEQVRIGIDVSTPRQDHLLGLEERGLSTRRSVGVRNRQPQGQLVPFSFSGSDVFDTTDTMDVFVFVPDRMYSCFEAKALLRFREFFASAKSAAAASSGSLTSDSGGGSTTPSGGGSTSGGESGHDHSFAFDGGAAGPAGTSHIYAPTGSGPGFYLNVLSGGGSIDTGPNQSSHDHSTPSHTHATPDHQHSVPGHGHALTLTYGVLKEAYPGSHSVTLKVYELSGGTWMLRETIGGLTGDTEDVDLTASITGPGNWRIELKSDAAQPNGGRLGCDVSGYVLGAIQSA